MQDIRSEKTQTREIDITRLLRMLWKRVWYIVAAVLIFGILACMVSAFAIEPTYRTSFTAYINNREQSAEDSSTTSSDLSASRGLMYVYQEIVVSRTVLLQAAAMCDMEEMGYAQVSNMVTAAVSSDSPILTVYVETGDPALSKQLADAVAEIAPRQVAQVVTGSTMTLIDPAFTPSVAYSPNVGRNTLYGALLGLVLSVIALVLIDLIHDDVHAGDDLEGRYQIPVIGHIPDLQVAQKMDVKYGQTRERGGRR